MIKELIKDGLKYIPSQIVPAIVGLISIPIVTRLFPPADYGNYILVLSTVTVLTTLVGWLSMGIIRFYPAYERDKKLDIFYSTVIQWLFISVFGISVLFLTVLLIAKNYISQNLYNLMLIGVGVFICLSFFQTLLSFLRAKRLVGWYSGFFSWKSVGMYVIGLGLILGFNFGIEGLLWGTIISIILVIPWVWKKALNKFSLFKKKSSFSLSQEMAAYGFPLVIGNLAAWILSLSDRYILEFFRGPQEVGVYSASYAIGEHSILLIASLFLLAVGPLSIHIWEKEKKEKSRIFLTKTTRYFLLTCIPAVTGISVLARPILDVFTGADYFAGYTILPFIAGGIFFLGLSQRFGTVLTFYKKTIYNMWTLIIAGGVNLGLNLILIPKYGYFVAAITTLIGYIVMLILIVYFSRKFFIWPFPFKTLLRCMVASLIMGVGVYFLVNSLYFHSLVNLILGILFGIVIYSICIILFKEPLPEERAEIKSLFQKYVFKRDN